MAVSIPPLHATSRASLNRNHATGRGVRGAGPSSWSRARLGVLVGRIRTRLGFADLALHPGPIQLLAFVLALEGLAPVLERFLDLAAPPQRVAEMVEDDRARAVL